jgi:hypothetical protein
MNTRITILCLLLVACQLFPGCAGERTAIYVSGSASPLARLAAGEVRRYVYLATGTLLEIRSTDEEVIEGIVLGVDEGLKKQQYKLKTTGSKLMITGGSDQGLLYGAYELAEQFGFRFYLYGDVVPDERIPREEIGGDFEYFIRVNAPGEEALYPVTAEDINLTVVIIP